MRKIREVLRLKLELKLTAHLVRQSVTRCEIGKFKNVTRVKAVKIRPTKFAPNSRLYTDAKLDAQGVAQFRAAGQACRVASLMSR